MKRVLNIDLEYDLDGLAQAAPEGSPAVPPAVEITRNIIENTYAQNHPKMKVKLAKVWRRVVKACETAIDSQQTLVVLSDEDYKSLCSEIESCDYDNRQAFIVPVLTDELERIAALTDKESAEILKTLEANKEAGEQVNKVLEMSKSSK